LDQESRGHIVLVFGVSNKIVLTILLLDTVGLRQFNLSIKSWFLSSSTE
jgi:hypothetical protein